MMPPKPKEVLDHHLFVDILEIDGDDITSFKDKGVYEITQIYLLYRTSTSPINFISLTVSL